MELKWENDSLKYVVNPSDIAKNMVPIHCVYMKCSWDHWNKVNHGQWLDVMVLEDGFDRVYRLFIESGKITDTNDGKLDKVYNQTVKKVTEDYESLGFNTAISQMMIFVNEAYKADTVYKPYAEGIVKMLSCITPHIGEEMWQLLGHESTIAYEPWPTYDEAKLVEDTITCVVQVNGKVRGKFEVAVGSSNEEL